eukprot:SAG11_NODE_560_length_8528_cov_4.697710_1_plen_137_part_10
MKRYEKIASAFGRQGIDLPEQVDLAGNKLPTLDEMREHSRSKVQPPNRHTKVRVAEHAASTCLQSVQRGRIARNALEEQQMAARRIQAMQRGKVSRREIEEQQMAARRIQAMQRGKVSRREIEEQQMAARRIQAMQR